MLPCGLGGELGNIRLVTGFCWNSSHSKKVRHAKMAIRLIMKQLQPIDEYEEDAEDEDEEDRYVGICSQHYRMWRPECGSFALPEFQPQQYTECDINDSTTKLDIASPESETRTISACCKATMGCEPTR